MSTPSMLVDRRLPDQTRSAYLWITTCAEDRGYLVTAILSTDKPAVWCTDHQREQGLKTELVA
ncbi:hypothetical protein [Mycobacterium sp. DBP42]|uniref:hypothetical protein n=1 Tax=Mycobacterium sp. DBP42 TaxID=2545267 RepID=UPI00110CBC34|nr:hypothetical protein [Mycobacterium sp. DBP42]TMS49178.1 hypothetical protein E0T84_26145 [Mycobacterium sp. DBP42]